jgi:hypothetical protein
MRTFAFDLSQELNLDNAVFKCHLTHGNGEIVIFNEEIF